MSTTQLVVELPATLDVEEARVLLAAALFERDRLTLGQAAELAGYSKLAFPEILSRLGVDVFKAVPGELDQEVAMWRGRSPS